MIKIKKENKMDKETMENMGNKTEGIFNISEDEKPLYILQRTYTLNSGNQVNALGGIQYHPKTGKLSGLMRMRFEESGRKWVFPMTEKAVATEEVAIENLKQALELIAKDQATIIEEVSPITELRFDKDDSVETIAQRMEESDLFLFGER